LRTTVSVGHSASYRVPYPGGGQERSGHG
jgi:hypothetical protein